MGRVSLFDSEDSVNWTDAPAGEVLAAFARKVGHPVTVREGQRVRVIGASAPLPRIEVEHRPLWG